jgi:hypothetical protein
LLVGDELEQRGVDAGTSIGIGSTCSTSSSSSTCSTTN